MRSEDSKQRPTFKIDPGQLAEGARYDGIFVLRTNARITICTAVTGQVGRVFQTAGMALPPNLRENAAA